LSDVLLFVIPFFTFGLKVFSTVLPNFYLWKLSDVLLFLWFLSLCLVLRYFSTVLQFLPMKAGLSDVLLFVIPFLWS
jgi:hypothetical protein